ncbi:response regulator transcription factor [bacterium AH-315-C07]|nr:response regulator transcription factor [bacterium AH-315-C07]
MMPIKVLIVDDNQIMHVYIKNAVRSIKDMAVIGAAFNGQEAVEKAQDLSPDVIVMDISMPVTNGLTATRIIKKKMPEINILIHSSNRLDQYFHAARNAGATGFLVKPPQKEDLINAIRTVACGKNYFKYES